LHDGGFLLGDNASGGSSNPADVLPPIGCTGDTTDPTVVAGFVEATSFVVCDGPAGIAQYSQLYYDGIIPAGFPSEGFGIGTAENTSYGLCVPGTYDVAVVAGVVFPAGYTPITPEIQEYTTIPVDITSCT
jgi:hypothetical protein